MTLSTYVTYCLALAVAAAIPGPGMTAIVARTLASNVAATIPMGLGLILGDLVYLTTVVLGLAVVAQTFGIAFMVVKYLGAAYLAWLAFKIWRRGIAIGETGTARRERPWMAFLSGLLVTLGNPKTMLFYIALVPSILDLRAVTIDSYAALAGATAVVLMLVLLPYMALASRIRRLMGRPDRLRTVNRVAAGCLAGSALAIAARAS